MLVDGASKSNLELSAKMLSLKTLHRGLALKREIKTAIDHLASNLMLHLLRKVKKTLFLWLLVSQNITE